MRVTGFGLLAFVLLALAAGVGRTEDDKVKTVLDKGIKALGGEEKLAKLQALSFKGKGVFFVAGKQVPFTATMQTQGMDKNRSTIAAVDDKGVKTTEIRVINGDKHWIKTGADETRPMTRDELYEEKENLYFSYVTTLVPLKGKDFKLAALGEAKVEGKAVVGLKVSRDGHRDVKLFFDKENGVLVKAERAIKDTTDKNKEHTEEILYENYKDVDGLKIAMRYVTRWDGKPWNEADMSEAKALEKLDESTFAKP